jgi:hypothetical protein
METLRIFFYLLEGGRCFFLNPCTRPNLVEHKLPQMAIVLPCQKPYQPKTSRVEIGDTIPINNKYPYKQDSLVWGVLLDLQE